MKWRKNMEALDLSSLHDILIEDDEGNVQPMDQPYYKAKKIAPGTWQLLSDGDYSYVIEGDDETILIDSGMGAGNIRQYVEKELTPGKPCYRMLLTHNHPDHTLNCYQFDAVYMSPKSYKGRAMKMGPFEGLDVPDDYPVVFLEDGDVINLKGRPLEVFNIEEHAQGSLQFLDRKNHILFCGDELNGNFFDSRISVEYSFRNLTRWMSFRDAYDTLCAGNGIHDAVFVDRYYKTAKYILEGHAAEGEEFYTPYMDRSPSIFEKDGKQVRARRSPNMEGFSEILKKAGYEKALEKSHGLGCFCYTRKLTPDGMFDRQLTMNDCRFCYYLNRIWDRDSSNKNYIIDSDN